jgi:hypothetical protein
MLQYGDASDPTPASDEIVVDVNAADYKVRLGGAATVSGFRTSWAAASRVWLPRSAKA